MFVVFEKLVAPLLERVRANRAESRTLAQTRDLLLPRLMSGELRVAGAERLVGEVA
jgi:type I restriction enzyme S subunit